MEDTNSADDRETSLYSTQIQYLDKKLEGCQLKCDEFKKHNMSLISQCKALEEDKYDISEFLKYNKIEREQKVDELAELLEIQQQVAEQVLKDLRLQQSLQIEELKEQVDMLTSEIRRQAAQIEEQKEKKEQLRQQLCDLKSLEEQPLKEKKEHEAVMQSLTIKEQTETSRVIKKTRKVLNDWFERRTSEIIQEEKALHSERMQQLQVMLEENEALLEERDSLQSYERDLSAEIDVMKEDALRIEKDISTNEETAERLTEECQQLKSKLEKYSFIREGMLPQIEDLRKCVASASEERCQKAATAVQLEAELQRERRRGEQLEGDMKEAVIILRHILMDSEQASETQLCLKLQEVLEGNSPPVTDSALRDSIETRSGGRKPQTTDPEPARTETLNLATDPLFLLARYRPGDLGVIPRPTWKLSP
ncbi:cilia- and flagella-associated protein 157-like [Tautogolabrus adspersus]